MNFSTTDTISYYQCGTCRAMNVSSEGQCIAWTCFWNPKNDGKIVYYTVVNLDSGKGLKVDLVLSSTEKNTRILSRSDMESKAKATPPVYGLNLVLLVIVCALQL